MDLTQKQLDLLIDAFNLFDTDKSGAISRGELAKVMQAIGDSISESELNEMIRAVDADKSGDITLDEFIQLMSGKISKETAHDEILAAFRVFDNNNDGKITPDELHQVMSNLGHPISEAEVEVMIQRVDANQDGIIDYGEFIKLMDMWK